MRQEIATCKLKVQEAAKSSPQFRTSPPTGAENPWKKAASTTSTNTTTQNMNISKANIAKNARPFPIKRDIASNTEPAQSSIKTKVNAEIAEITPPAEEKPTLPRCSKEEKNMLARQSVSKPGHFNPKPEDYRAQGPGATWVSANLDSLIPTKMS